MCSSSGELGLVVSRRNGRYWNKLGAEIHRWIDEPWRVHGYGYHICILISAAQNFIMDYITITMNATSEKPLCRSSKDGVIFNIRVVRFHIQAVESPSEKPNDTS